MKVWSLNLVQHGYTCKHGLTNSEELSTRLANTGHFKRCSLARLLTIFHTTGKRRQPVRLRISFSRGSR